MNDRDPDYTLPDDPVRWPSLISVAIFAVFALVIAAAVSLQGDRPFVTTEVAATEPEVSMPALPPIATIASIDAPADPITVVAAPVVERTTTTPAPPPDPCTLEPYVNGLQYAWMTHPPAVEAYRIVAACLGWDTYTIDRWQAGITLDLIPKESGYCPLNSGGSIVNAACEVVSRGHGSDTGFGQLISLWYDGDGYLCVNFGYCGQWSILQSPWHSMRALLLAVMYDGKGPWCFNAWARDYHHLLCSTMPRNWP